MNKNKDTEINKNIFKMSKAFDVLLDTINNMIGSKIKSIKIDTTKIGMISENNSANNHKYKVTIDGQEYSIMSATEQKYNVGDRVLVLIIGSNYNNKYIIGRAR